MAKNPDYSFPYHNALTFQFASYSHKFRKISWYPGLSVVHATGTGSSFEYKADQAALRNIEYSRLPAKHQRNKSEQLLISRLRA